MTPKCPDCKRDQDDCICASPSSAPEVWKMVGLEDLIKTVLDADAALSRGDKNAALIGVRVAASFVSLIKSHVANRKTLAALEEQNEKLRETLTEAKSMVGHPDNIAIINSALSLPNLSSPVLNRIKAEAYREAAEIAGPEDSYQDQWFKAKSDSCAKLRAKADELEQSK